MPCANVKPGRVAAARPPAMRCRLCMSLSPEWMMVSGRRAGAQGSKDHSSRGGIPAPPGKSRQRQAAHEHLELIGLERGPLLVAGQRRGHHHRRAVAGVVELGEVHRPVVVHQRGLGKRVLAHQPVQPGAAVRPQRLAVGEQEVEGAELAHLRHQFAQREGELFHAGQAGVRLGQLLHQPAEGALAVGGADRAEVAVQRREVVLEVAVVGEHPLAAPELAHEGVGVFQRHLADGGLAHVGNDVAALERVLLQEFRHGRLGRALVVDEQAQALALEKRDAPAVGMVVGVAAALAEAGEAERRVGRRGAVESEQLAHGAILIPAGRGLP
eukprot:Opistho-1_new@57268